MPASVRAAISSVDLPRSACIAPNSPLTISANSRARIPAKGLCIPATLLVALGTNYDRPDDAGTECRMTHEFDGSDSVIDEGGLSLRQKLNLAVTAVLGIALALFIFQNTERQQIKFLSFEPNMPIWLLVLGSAAAGAVLSVVGTALWRRKRRRS